MNLTDTGGTSHNRLSMNIEAIGHWADAIESTLTSILLAAGAFIAYFKFIAGKLSKTRLEPSIDCEVTRKRHVDELRVVASVFNKGIIRAQVPEGGFFVELLAPEEIVRSPDAQYVSWKSVTAFPMFENHNKIETGESLRDQSLIIVPRDLYSHVKLRLRVEYEGKNKKYLHNSQNIEWETVVIVNLERPD